MSRIIRRRVVLTFGAVVLGTASTLAGGAAFAYEPGFAQRCYDQNLRLQNGDGVDVGTYQGCFGVNPPPGHSVAERDNYKQDQAFVTGVRNVYCGVTWLVNPGCWG